MNTTPLVSYVMPVFNRSNVIERALDGIIKERAENYSNIEIVVIDGGSNDGTQDILERYGKKIDYWLSERDSGVAEAFNKGVRAAKGSIIRYVASDDGIVNGFTDRMVRHLVTNPSVDVVGALAKNSLVGCDGVAHPDLSKPQYSAGRLDFQQALLWTDGIRFSLIESWFMRRCVFDRIGFLDTQYRICPDYDFALRMIREGIVFDVLPYEIIEKCFYSDGSNAVADTTKAERERRSLIWKHAGRSPQGWVALYNFPRPLHSRLCDMAKAMFFSKWLLVVHTWKRISPRSYSLLQGIIKR